MESKESGECGLYPEVVRKNSAQQNVTGPSEQEWTFSLSDALHFSGLFKCFRRPHLLFMSLSEIAQGYFVVLGLMVSFRCEVLQVRDLISQFLNHRIQFAVIYTHVNENSRSSQGPKFFWKCSFGRLIWIKTQFRVEHVGAEWRQSEDLSLQSIWQNLKEKLQEDVTEKASESAKKRIGEDVKLDMLIHFERTYSEPLAALWFTQWSAQFE